MTATQLVGAWRRIALEDHSPAGVIMHPIDRNPIDILIHDASANRPVQRVLCTNVPIRERTG